MSKELEATLKLRVGATSEDFENRYDTNLWEIETMSRLTNRRAQNQNQIIKTAAE